MRVRPPARHERKQRERNVVLLDESDPTLICLQNPSPGAGDHDTNHIFAYDRLYGPSAVSDNVFEDLAAPLVEGLFDGLNATIFAYGQTGSGKTFTITGGAERYSDRGIIPRALSYIFQKLGEGGAEVVGKCHHCGAPTESFVNCCNVDCNLLHLVCGACFAEHAGFCQPSCAAAPRRRLLSLALGAEAEAEGGATPPLALET